MPPPSTGTTIKNNKALGDDIPLKSSLGDFFESNELLMDGDDIYR